MQNSWIHSVSHLVARLSLFLTFILTHEALCHVTKTQFHSQFWCPPVPHGITNEHSEGPMDFVAYEQCKRDTQKTKIQAQLIQWFCLSTCQLLSLLTNTAYWREYWLFYPVLSPMAFHILRNHTQPAISMEPESKQQGVRTPSECGPCGWSDPRFQYLTSKREGRTRQAILGGLDLGNRPVSGILPGAPSTQFGRGR